MDRNNNLLWFGLAGILSQTVLTILRVFLLVNLPGSICASVIFTIFTLSILYTVINEIKNNNPKNWHQFSFSNLVGIIAGTAIFLFLGYLLTY